MGLLQHLTAWLGSFTSTWLIAGTGSCLCPLYSGVPKAPWKTVAPTDLFPPKSRQGAEGAGVRGWLLRGRAGCGSSMATHSPGLCNWRRHTVRASGQGHPAANPASALAVGKSVNLPDGHWEEPMFIIPSTEPIVVVSGL